MSSWLSDTERRVLVTLPDRTAANPVKVTAHAYIINATPESLRKQLRKKADTMFYEILKVSEQQQKLSAALILWGGTWWRTFWSLPWNCCEWNVPALRLRSSCTLLDLIWKNLWRDLQKVTTILSGERTQILSVEAVLFRWHHFLLTRQLTCQCN